MIARMLVARVAKRKREKKENNRRLIELEQSEGRDSYDIACYPGTMSLPQISICPWGGYHWGRSEEEEVKEEECEEAGDCHIAKTPYQYTWPHLKVLAVCLNRGWVVKHLSLPPSFSLLKWRYIIRPGTIGGWWWCCIGGGRPYRTRL